MTANRHWSTSPAAPRPDAMGTTTHDLETTPHSTPESRSNVRLGNSAKVNSPQEYSRGVLGLDYSSSSEDESSP